MAGDWIKIEGHLHQKPEVLYMAATLKCSVADVVLGLIKVWSWAARCDELYPDGVPLSFVDELAGLIGFAGKMYAVGWLSLEKHWESKGDLELYNLNFDEYADFTLPEPESLAKTIRRQLLELS